MSASLPSVSVIMPAWNEAATIGEQLEALARQEDVTPLEIIVADNGSTDATLEIVESYRERLPQLRWIVADAVQGPSHARNEGAKVAAGEVLAFCDSDDVVDDRWLVELVRGLSDAGLVGGRLDLQRLNDGEKLIWREIRDPLVPDSGVLAKALSSNMAISSSLFFDVGMFNEDFVWGHDHEFAYRVQLLGHRFSFIPGALVHYRIKTSMCALLRREYQDSVGAAHVYATYRRQGAERQSLFDATKVVLWLIVHVPDLRRRATAGRWLRKVAGLAGRISGCLRYRVLYP